MTQYVEKNLLNNERIICKGYVSWWSQTPYITAALFAFAVFIAIISNQIFSTALYTVVILGFLYLIAHSYIAVYTTELALTNKRFISKKGFIRVETSEIFIEKIESASLNQSILGRIFNYGTIRLTGNGGTGAQLDFVHNPSQLRTNILNEIERTKELHRMRVTPY